VRFFDCGPEAFAAPIKTSLEVALVKLNIKVSVDDLFQTVLERDENGHAKPTADVDSSSACSRADRADHGLDSTPVSESVRNPPQPANARERVFVSSNLPKRWKGSESVRSRSARSYLGCYSQ